MKRIISLSTALVLGTCLLQAQQTVSERGEITFGIRGGINFQNITGDDENGDKMENDLIVGFNVGVNAEFPLGSEFYLQPGLLFTTKGAKNEDNIWGQAIKGKVRISYLELPVNFIYKPLLGEGHVLLGFGPYLALGISGTVDLEGGGVSEEVDIKFKNKVSINDRDDVFYARPLDAGANLLAGYEFSNRVSFQLNAQLGLTKVNSEYEDSQGDQTKAKNTGFGISLGYRF